MIILFEIGIYPTHITVSNAKEASVKLSRLLELFEYEDEYEEVMNVLGYVINEEKDILYFNKGVDVEYIRKCLVDVSIKTYSAFEPDEMIFDYEEIIPPRNEEQVEMINFVSAANEWSTTSNSPQIFMVSAVGTGKCIPYSSSIPTPNGFVNMGDLKVGDYVFNRFGKPTKIIEIYENGEKDIYKITLSDGRDCRCTIDHMWTVYIDNQLKNVLTSDLIEIIKHGKKVYIPCNDKVNFDFDKTPSTSFFRVLKELKHFEEIGNKSIFKKIRYINDEADESIISKALNALGYVVSSVSKEPIEYMFKIQASKKKYIQIENISFDNHTEKVRCIKVDDPEHLFLTENFIVTHNTYTSCVGAVLYKRKTLVICHRAELLKQWYSTFIEKVGMDDSDIHTLTTEDFLAAEQMKLDLGDVYLLSHQTFRFALHAMNNDFERVSKAIENLGIGLKIIDEAHLEFRNIVDIDMCMNIKRNLYLTATDGRSSKDENAIFKHVFTNAIKFTKNAKHKNKWIEYCIIFINTNVPYKVSKFQLENGRGMNATKYGKAVIKRDRNKTHFNAINELLRVIFNRDEHAKVLIFMPLIELCDELEFFINTHLNKDQSFDYDLRVGTINSHNTKLENEHSAKCDVIISTILSCGTGKDIPGLTDIICCSPFKSAITTQQVLGRLRYYGKNCGYWDIVDESVKMDMIFAKIRSKTIKSIALSMSSMQFSVF